MTPEQLAKSGSEHAHQTALFAWCALNVNQYPELKWFHAIPNGGNRGDTAQSRAIEGGRMKAEGVKRGVADCFLPVKCGHWSGLYIEMKKVDLKPKTAKSNGGLSVAQIEFKKFVQNQGYGWVVCYGWVEAKDILIQYLTQS
jgi:hypothetical protein